MSWQHDSLDLGLGLYTLLSLPDCHGQGQVGKNYPKLEEMQGGVAGTLGKGLMTWQPPLS